MILVGILERVPNRTLAKAAACVRLCCFYFIRIKIARRDARSHVRLPTIHLAIKLDVLWSCSDLCCGLRQSRI